MCYYLLCVNQLVSASRAKLAMLDTAVVTAILCFMKFNIFQVLSDIIGMQFCIEFPVNFFFGTTSYLHLLYIQTLQMFNS